MTDLWKVSPADRAAAVRIRDQADGYGHRARGREGFVRGRIPGSGLVSLGELHDSMCELLSGADHGVLQYGPTRGHRPLLESIVPLLAARHITVTLDNLLITSGSQQGLDLVSRVLVTPGVVVLVELSAYTGAISAFRNAQAHLVRVAQDEDGINLDDVDEVCQRERRAGRRVNLL